MVLAAPHDCCFFHPVLAHVAHPKIARRAIKREPPRLPKTTRPNLRSHLRLIEKWIIPGNSVGKALALLINIDANYFSKESQHVLPMSVRVLLRTGITHAQIQIAVRAKLDAP